VPICAVLSEHGIKIAPSIYYARAKTPITLAELDEANLGNALVDLIQPTGRHWCWQAVARRRRVGLEVGRDKVGRLLAMAGAIIRWRTAQAKNDDGQSRN
jgi:putative transposase